MRILSFIVWTIVGLILLGLIALGIALVPSVQTAWMQNQLAQRMNGQASIDGATVRFSSIALENFRLESSGTIITAPQVDAQLSLVKVVRDGRIEISQLRAKDWLIDLSQVTRATVDKDAQAGAGEAAPAIVDANSQMNKRVQTAVSYFLKNLLARLQLPCDRLDGIDLEGVVIVPSPMDGAPYRVNVRIEGGGFEATHDGTVNFTLMTVQFDLKDNAITTWKAQGHGTARIDADRSIGALTLKTEVTAQGTHLHDALAVMIDARLARDRAHETCEIDVTKADRTLLNLTADTDNTASTTRGSWRVALTDADTVYFNAVFSLPRFSVKGEGHFESEKNIRGLSVSGTLESVVGPGMTLSGVKLDRELRATTTFAVTNQTSLLHIDRLHFSLATNRPLAEVNALQPAELNWDRMDFSVEQPEEAWIDVSLPALPLEWLAPYTGGVIFKGGELSGRIFLHWVKGGFAIKPDGPLIAKNVNVAYASTPLLDHIDLTAAIAAQRTGDAWAATIASLDVSSAGKRLLTGKITLTPADSVQAASFSGQWTADLAALAGQPMVKPWGDLTGLTAAGDLHAALGGDLSLETKFAINAYSAPVFAGDLRAWAGDDGALRFEVPVTFIDGKTTTDVTLEGTWDQGGRGGDITLSGASAKLADLRRLLPPLAAISGMTLPGDPFTAQPGKERDAVPFWRAWVGTFRYALQNLETDHGTLRDVGGKLQFTDSGIQLRNIKWSHDGLHLNTLDGALAFDAAAATPYVMQAKGAMAKVDATALFPLSEKADSLVEGKFAMDTAYAGEGSDLPDLLASMQQTFHITSTVGIVRLLKVSVGDTLHEKETPMKDAVESVGGAVVSFFGGKGKDIDSVRHVSKRAQAVLDFTNDPDVVEIGYDTLSLDAAVAADGAVILDHIALSAPNVRLTGKGTIQAGTTALTRRQLDLELHAAFKGRQATQLTAIGLVNDKKNADDYFPLDPPLRFTGTLAQLDKKAWHDLLAAAMTAPEPAAPAKKK